MSQMPPLAPLSPDDAGLTPQAVVPTAPQAFAETATPAAPGFAPAETRPVEPFSFLPPSDRQDWTQPPVPLALNAGQAMRTPAAAVNLPSVPAAPAEVQSLTVETPPAKQDAVALADAVRPNLTMVEHEKITIEHRLMSFITPQMISLLIVVCCGVFMVRGMVITTFLHHIELNGIIVALMLFGLYRVLDNNYDLYRTARFLREIELVEADPAAPEAKVARLDAGMARDGQMLDVQNMELALKKMRLTGLLVLTDNDARMIKSKLGARVRFKYNHITFFAGLLISFGLLGTFVGLIDTVAAVGDQMGKVANSFGQPGGGMSVMDLIKGISKPLEGMGTAFGASLFGLAGSMLLGAMNYVGGHAQNEFIENASRWIDDHIPRVKPNVAKQSEKVPAVQRAQQAQQAQKNGDDAPARSATGMSAEQTIEFGAFIVLAEETHRQLRALGAHVADQAKLLQTQETLFREMMALQAKQMAEASAQRQQQTAMLQSQLQMLGDRSAAQGAQSEAQTVDFKAQISRLEAIGGQLGGQLSGALQSWHNDLNGQLQQQTAALKAVHTGTAQLVSTVERLEHSQAQFTKVVGHLPLAEIKPALSTMERLTANMQRLLETKKS